MSVALISSHSVGFPNVLGCIDGSQIKIRKPRTNEADYVNRKGYHSINVQVIFLKIIIILQK
jgi:hypothetical protein